MLSPFWWGAEETAEGFGGFHPLLHSRGVPLPISRRFDVPVISPPSSDMLEIRQRPLKPGKSTGALVD